MNIGPEYVLSVYFVPFRSQSWDDLPYKPDSIEFGLRIWRDVLKRVAVHTIIAFGKEISPHMIDILDGARIEARHSAGWGTEIIDKYRFGPRGRLIVLSHLSHFKLFSKPQSEAAFRFALEQGGELASAQTAATYRREGIIRKLVSGNLKQIGSKSHLRFECDRDGMIITDYERAVYRALGEAEAKKMQSPS